MSDEFPELNGVRVKDEYAKLSAAEKKRVKEVFTELSDDDSDDFVAGSGPDSDDEDVDDETDEIPKTVGAAAGSVFRAPAQATASAAAASPAFRIVHARTMSPEDEGGLTGGFGTHCVAARDVARGECVLFEAPLAAVHAKSQLAENLPDDTNEWQLVSSLLAQGVRWGGGRGGGGSGGGGDEEGVAYAVSPALDGEGGGGVLADATAALLAERHDVPPELAKHTYRVVCSNAFALESLALRVSYGAAFFPQAARFNHSCDPSCLSVRVGDHMAVWAVCDVAAGLELTHSYLAPHLLLLPEARRAELLNFRCRCRRCAEERAAPPGRAAASERLLFPPGYATTAGGRTATRGKA